VTRYFYDTEFLEDGHTIELISIGLVADDGRELYAVNADMPVKRILAHDWLRANVVPSLPFVRHDGLRPLRKPFLNRSHADVHPRPEIASMVRDFILGTDPDELPHVELWADYGAYDHVALCQLFGTMMDLPEGMPMFTHDIQQAASALGLNYKDLPEQPSGLHNALADARHAKAEFDFLTGFGADA
jgi:3' exoribonuclease, RNase T-like